MVTASNISKHNNYIAVDIQWMVIVHWCVFVCGSSGFKNIALRSRSLLFQSKLQITFFFVSFTVNMFDAFSSQKPLTNMDENEKATYKSYGRVISASE